MLIMTMVRRMDKREAATMTATTVEKVVLVILWSVVAMMLPPLAMVIMELIMLA
jgi:hypothetical protein